MLYLDCNLWMVRDFQDDVNHHHLIHDIFKCVGDAEPHEAAANLLLNIATVAIQVELQSKRVCGILLYFNYRLLVWQIADICTTQHSTMSNSPDASLQFELPSQLRLRISALQFILQTVSYSLQD